jgi:quinate dehydrogenase
MPHKLAIMPYLDDLTPEAKAVGAVNTIFRRDSLYIGTNTDTVGVAESFFHNVKDEIFRNRPGMVIGGGGAARAAVYALVRLMKCATVYLVNRDKSEVDAVVDWCKSQGYGDGLVHVSTTSQAEQVDGPGAIVSCVPNFPPKTDVEKEARRITEVFLNKPRKGAILEMCYHPVPWTEIAALSEQAGWQVILGTEAVIYQGLEAQRYWTGRQISDMPVQKVKDVIAQELEKARL